jgi:D-serine deaminase-like pyridoxal phosphate-dependent protein
MGDATMDAFDLDTPAVYVDLDALERNVRGMQDRCRRWGVGLRPHTKTHKIPEIARMQLDAGAVGITVAKIGEAEVLPGDDVLVAYPVMADKLPRLRALARDRRVTVVVDSVEGARGLPGIGALVEVDIGVGRCGVVTPK